MQNTTKPCEYCGSELEVKEIVIGDRVYFGGHKPCTCEQAQADREVAEKIAKENEERRHESIRERKLERSGIPKRYRNAHHPYADKMAKMVKCGQGFYIEGPNGTGKTTLAMAAGIPLIEQNIDVYAISTYDLMDAMRSRKDEDRNVYDRAVSCDVLILDDLGKEASNTQYACERLFAIIDTRDKEMLPSIVTSNYSRGQLAEQITEGDIGVAIASRLSPSVRVLLDGEDWRLDA